MPGQLNVALVDFGSEVDALTREQSHTFQFQRLKTIWNGGSGDLPLDSFDIIFVHANYSDSLSSGVHATENRKTRAVMERGGLVVVFTGKSAAFHLQNLVGIPLSVNILGQVSADPTRCHIRKHTVLDKIVSRFGNKIIAASLFISTPETSFDEEEFLGHPQGVVGILVSHGTGRCVYLPTFGPDNAAVIRLILGELLPDLSPHLFFDEKYKWLQEDTYLMPSLLAVRQERRQADETYSRLVATLDDRYQTEWSMTQMKWNRLLTESSDTLKEAVKEALEALGSYAIDVDKYWADKEPSRPKEEDLWYGYSKDPIPSMPDVALVEVKSKSRGSASEDDYGAIIKYLNRRKGEFNNPQLTGLLVINHFSASPASARPPAFSPVMEADSLRDKVTLVTTWDLFRLIQRIAQGATTPADVRALLSKAGPLSLSLSL